MILVNDIFEAYEKSYLPFCQAVMNMIVMCMIADKDIGQWFGHHI